MLDPTELEFWTANGEKRPGGGSRPPAAQRPSGGEQPVEIAINM
jgi:hypothetical protein